MNFIARIHIARTKNNLGEPKQLGPHLQKDTVLNDVQIDITNERTNMTMQDTSPIGNGNLTDG